MSARELVLLAVPAAPVLIWLVERALCALLFRLLPDNRLRLTLFRYREGPIARQRRRYWKAR